MKKILTLLLLVSVLADAQTKKSPGADPRKQFMDLITAEELRAHLFFIASDNLQGRKAGTAWERLAAEYLASHHQGMNIPPLTKNKSDDNTDYFQHFEFNNGRTAGRSQNVLAYLEGNDPVLKNEVIIISAHYDHLGTGEKTANDSIFNGAADDGSGTVALLELAESFQSARNQGVKFKRSIVFFQTRLLLVT